jgi:hypothetical protein
MPLLNPATPALRTAHLITLSFNVDYAGLLNIGATPHGRRRIAPVSGGVFTGTRLSGSLLPGGWDWVLVRPDGNFTIDVRLALKTGDGALIYLSYQGLFKASAEAHARLRNRETLRDDEYILRITAKFETGAPSYQWLNDTLAIGAGRQTAAGASYDIFEVI